MRTGRPSSRSPRGRGRPRSQRRSWAALAGLLTVLLPAGSLCADLSRSQEVKARIFARLAEGTEAYRKGDPKLAIDILGEVARVALNSFRAHYYLGLAFKADRQYSKAIESLGTALELDPTHLQARVELGDCWLKRGDVDEALAEYHRVLGIQQGYAPAWDGIGRGAEATGDDDRAAESFRRAVELNPGFPDAYLNLGDLYLRKGRLTEAVDLFVRAIAVRPDFAAAYNRLGVAYARQRLGNAAIASLRKAAELEKGNPWHPYTIGLIEMELGDVTQARRDFDAAMALDRNYIEAYVAKARLLRRLGDFDAAAGLLETALALPTEDRKLKEETERLHQQVAGEAVAHRELAARVDAGTAGREEMRGLADLRALTGDYAGAAESLRAASGLATGADAAEPGAASELFRLGYYLLLAGSFEEAERAFERVRALRPASVAALMNLGLSLEGQGKARAAEAAYLEAGRADPKAAAPLIALGNARVLEGRYAEAASAFEEALRTAEEFPEKARVEAILRVLRRRVEGIRPAAGEAMVPPQPGEGRP